MTDKEIIKTLRKELKPSRFNHTIGVMETAVKLAEHYNCDWEKAKIAGLLHDCAKCLPPEESIRLCREKGVKIQPVEYENPSLLHAKAGALLARDKYSIEDEDILHAILVHTTGQPDMSLLDKIIFTADYIEPGRNQAPRLDYLRKTAFENLDTAVAEILFDTLNYLKEKNTVIDTTTQDTFDFYSKYLARKEEEK